MRRKHAAKRTIISPRGKKRFVRRSLGRFTSDQTDLGRSLSQDRNRARSRGPVRVRATRVTDPRDSVGRSRPVVSCHARRLEGVRARGASIAPLRLLRVAHDDGVPKVMRWEIPS